MANEITAQGPVFIGGVERSGKTYMRMMLEAQLPIAFTRRTNMWTLIYGRFGDLRREENLERCLHGMMDRKLIHALDPDVERIRREFRRGPATYGRLFALFHRHVAERAGKTRWGDQSGFLEQRAGAIFDAYPDARFIHLLRDPRDRFEALCTRDARERRRLGQATAKWLFSARLARHNQRAFPGRYMVVRYESMVASPEALMGDVCRFLGEAFCPEMIALPDVPRFRESAPERNGKSPLSTAFIGRFQIRLSPHEIAFIQGHAGGQMVANGYAPAPARLTGGARARYAVLTWAPHTLQMVAWRVVHAGRALRALRGAGRRRNGAQRAARPVLHGDSR